MKKALYMAAICCGAMLAGCKGFLEEYSQTDLRPGSVQDLQEMMMYEAYPSDYDNTDTFFGRYLELLTDDAEQVDMSVYADNEQLRNSAITNIRRGMGPYTWDREMFETMQTNGGETNTYEMLYAKIKGCNVALDNVDKVAGTIAEKARLRGEALALRSFYYFYLVNLFGQPYNAEGVDVNQTPGVPLILSSNVEDLYPVRASVGRVYEQIEDDLLEAVPLLEQYGQTTSKYRVTDMFAYTLLSRMYLYMENWAEAARWADKVIAERPTLLNLATGSASTGSIPAPVSSPANGVLTATSPEAIWVYSNASEWRNSFAYMQAVYMVSPSLANLYDHVLSGNANDDKRDLRPSIWGISSQTLDQTTWQYTYKLWYFCKASINLMGVGGKGMRVAELYLNRAEANIRIALAGGDQSLLTKALADLNHIRLNRWDTRNGRVYTPVEIADGEQLLRFCLEERRRELCYEEHRWFDLRRQGMPEIRRNFQLSPDDMPAEIVLEQGDNRYVLPFAKETLDLNPNLTQNPQ